ncbi:MAG: helix-turn-helix domain-containing protein [Sciscionella sp.]
MPVPINPRAAQLGSRLRELRATRFRSGAEFARQLGWQQTRVSKLEVGSQLPTAEDLGAWVAGVGDDDDMRAELGDMLTHARVAYAVFGDRYRKRGTIAARQAEIAAGERDAVVLREYQPACIPGIVQTGAYARDMLNAPGGPTLTGSTPEEVERLIGERIKRQEFLYQPGRQVQIVLGEAALSMRFGSVATLVGQLDRLVTLTDLPAVDLRVLPFSVPSPVLPLAGISIEDDRAVFAETLTEEQRVTDPESIAAHLKAFAMLRDAALAGADAVSLIRRVAGELRG